MPKPYIAAFIMAIATVLLVIAAFVDSPVLAAIGAMFGGAYLAIMTIDYVDLRRLIRERRRNPRP